MVPWLMTITPLAVAPLAVASIVISAVSTVVVVITGAAKQSTGQGTHGGTDSSTFEGPSALVSNNSARSGADRSTNNSSPFRMRAIGRAGNGTSKREDTAKNSQ